MQDLPGKFGEADITILRYFNPARHAVWIPFFQVISDTTRLIVFGLPLLLLFAAILRRDLLLMLQSITVLASVVIADNIALLMKIYFDRPRPFALHPEIIPYSDSGNASFPSGHTVRAVALAAAVCFLFPKWRYRVPAVIWAALVGFSRVYLGMHYPSDVLGATIVAIIVAWLVCFAMRRLFRA